MQVMSEGGLSGRGVEGPPEPGGRSVRDNQLRILALADKAVTPGSGRGDGLSFRALRECSSPKADRCEEPTRPASWVPAGRLEAWRRRSSDPCHLWLSRAVAPHSPRPLEAHLVCRAHRLGCAPSGVFMDFEMNHPGGDAPPPPSLPPPGRDQDLGHLRHLRHLVSGTSQGAPCWLAAAHGHATCVGRSHRQPSRTKASGRHKPAIVFGM